MICRFGHSQARLTTKQATPAFVLYALAGHRHEFMSSSVCTAAPHCEPIFPTSLYFSDTTRPFCGANSWSRQLLGRVHSSSCTYQVALLSGASMVWRTNQEIPCSAHVSDVLFLKLRVFGSALASSRICIIF